jgi:hypothetical protein
VRREKKFDIEFSANERGNGLARPARPSAYAEPVYRTQIEHSQSASPYFIAADKAGMMVSMILAY